MDEHRAHEVGTPPHVDELPFWQKLRVYLGGADNCIEYELKRDHIIMFRALAQIRDSGYTDPDELVAIANHALEQVSDA